MSSTNGPLTQTYLRCYAQFFQAIDLARTFYDSWQTAAHQSRLSLDRTPVLCKSSYDREWYVLRFAHLLLERLSTFFIHIELRQATRRITFPVPI